MTTLGKYELHEQLGRGGFGTVYRATDTSLGREVALKVLHPQLMIDEDFVERFRKEARVLAAVDSHYIVTIYELDEDNGRIFIAMRYLPGGSLKQMIENQGSLSFTQVFSILKQVMSGLSEAHSHGLIHRDLKPENILFDSHKEAVITDFGLVRESNNSFSGTPLSVQGILGTPNYIAPEIWSGEPATVASDIYALGCILYEMLTGKLLFVGKNVPLVMKLHFDELHLPEQWPDGVPQGITSVLEKTLAKDPRERYQTVKELEKALEATLEEPEIKEPLLEQLEVKPGKSSVKVDPDPVIHSQGPKPDDPPQTNGNLKSSKQKLTYWGLGIAGLAIIGLVILLLTKNHPNPVIPTAEVTKQAILSNTLEPTNISKLKIGSSIVSSKDGMKLMYVPAGDFLMGSLERTGGDDEHPQHTVYLDAYWIDQTEVTNAMYEKCVTAGSCTRPFNSSSITHSSYYGNSQFSDYPVIYVDWNQAQSYCQWAGRELPTEAQWEKAARGLDGQTYPWGNQTPNQNRVNYNSKIGDTTPVGQYLDGSSPFGTLNMAGNVKEWVKDWYSSDYYSNSPTNNPSGPTTGTKRVVRGGSWHYYDFENIRTASRANDSPTFSDINIGFRCVQNITK